MKRYFFYALILVSASVTSVSAFATCPMQAAQQAKAAQGNAGVHPQMPEGGPQGVPSAPLAAPEAPPPGFQHAKPVVNNPS